MAELIARGASGTRRVALVNVHDDLGKAIRLALENAGVLERLRKGGRIAIKPNLTYPYYKPGVTTSPRVLRQTVRVLRDYTASIAIVETDGGYGAWLAEDAFAGHGIYELQDEFGIEVVNLCDEPHEMISFPFGRRTCRIPMPVRLMHDIDLLISMPVPKVHAMTGLSLGYKNQWGCIPDVMRLRRHHAFNEGIVAINKVLKPIVLGDGTYFLDRHGPLDGEAVRMDCIIAATDAGAFDLYVSELMRFPWRRVPHLRRAVALNDMPASLDQIACNIAPSEAAVRAFHISRTARHWLALAAFKSCFLTWLVYESWFGRVVVHGILYAIVGKPVKQRSGMSSQKALP